MAIFREEVYHNNNEVLHVKWCIYGIPIDFNNKNGQAKLVKITQNKKNHT